MTRDTAALLAQIIPIMGLGLGLEIRSFGPQLLEFTRSHLGSYRLSAFRFGYGVLCIIPPTLGAVEAKVVYLAVGPGDWIRTWGTMFLASIVIIFSVPGVQGLIYHSRSLQLSGVLKRRMPVLVLLASSWLVVQLFLTFAVVT
jgi:hypothetical protein